MAISGLCPFRPKLIYSTARMGRATDTLSIYSAVNKKKGSWEPFT